MEPGTAVEVLIDKEWKKGIYLREDSEVAYLKVGETRLSVALAGKDKTWRFVKPAEPAKT